MTSYVSADLRRLVESRASHICEYCLIHAEDTYLGCQVDHIISEKYGGLTQAENLGYACTFCNRPTDRMSARCCRVRPSSHASSIHELINGPTTFD